MLPLAKQHFEAPRSSPMSVANGKLVCPLCQESIDAPAPGTEWVQCEFCGGELATSPNRSQLVADFSLPLDTHEVNTVLYAEPRPSVPRVAMPSNVTGESPRVDVSDGARVVIAIDFG